MSAAAVEPVRPSYVPASAVRIEGGWEEDLPYARNFYPDPGTMRGSRGRGEVFMLSSMKLPEFWR